MRERILGAEELPGVIASIPDRIGWAVAGALDLGGVAELARGLCPVDTGALAGSVRAERIGALEAALIAGGPGYVNPRTGRVVDYAAAVHGGAGGRLPRPFLMQALSIEARRIASEILEGVEP